MSIKSALTREDVLEMIQDVIDSKPSQTKAAEFFKIDGGTLSKTARGLTPGISPMILKKLKLKEMTVYVSTAKDDDEKQAAKPAAEQAAKPAKKAKPATAKSTDAAEAPAKKVKKKPIDL